jgi:hypothetical protein
LCQEGIFYLPKSTCIVKIVLTSPRTVVIIGAYRLK